MKTDRTKKLKILTQIINGDIEPLKKIKADNPEKFTEEELEQRRLYLTKLKGRVCTLEETTQFFGKYNRIYGHYYILPNGMKLFFGI